LRGEVKAGSTPLPVRRVVERYRGIGMLALALALYVLEGLLPRPVPWFRLGLSNIVILLVLLRQGPIPALKISLARTVLGSLFLGNLLTPVILLNLAGSLASWGVMSALLPLYPGKVSLVGLSLTGAAFHAAAQWAVAVLVLLPGGLAWDLLPLILLPSLVAGVIVGLLTAVVLPQEPDPRDHERRQGGRRRPRRETPPERRQKMRWTLIGLAALLLLACTTPTGDDGLRPNEAYFTAVNALDVNVTLLQVLADDEEVWLRLLTPKDPPLQPGARITFILDQGKYELQCQDANGSIYESGMDLTAEGHTWEVTPEDQVY
jgi:heptaprenyl diphosphate synthase